MLAGDTASPSPLSDFSDYPDYVDAAYFHESGPEGEAYGSGSGSSSGSGYGSGSGSGGGYSSGSGSGGGYSSGSGYGGGYSSGSGSGGGYSSGSGSGCATPPSVTLSPLGTIHEGDSVYISGTASGSCVEFVTVYFGDGSSDYTYGSGSFGFWHTYYDNNQYGTPPDIYTVTAMAHDTNCATDSDNQDITVLNVAPTVTIDSISPYYDNENGQIDEGETFRVEGHVTDPGIYDGMTVTVLIDWNGDGDTDDDGEQIWASVWGGYGSDWYFDAYVYVPDDGPSGTWSNGTPDDELTVKVKAEDKDGGTHEASDTVTIYNVPVTFSGDPWFSFSYDEDWNVTSITISASFQDPGYQDRHRATVSYGDGTSEIIDIPFGDYYFTTTRDFSPAESIADILPIDITISDDDSESVTVIIDGPSAGDDSFEYPDPGEEYVDIDVLSNDGDELTIQFVTSPSDGGTAEIITDSYGHQKIRFRPPASYNPSDPFVEVFSLGTEFQYTVVNAMGVAAQARPTRTLGSLG